MDTHKYSQLICDRNAKAIPKRTKSLSNKLQWNNQTSILQKKKKKKTFNSNTLQKKLTHNGKHLNEKKRKHLNVSPETIKLSKNNIGENLRKPGLG